MFVLLFPSNYSFCQYKYLFIQIGNLGFSHKPKYSSSCMLKTSNSKGVASNSTRELQELFFLSLIH